MNKEATLITSSPWKTACWETKMSDRGLLGLSLPVELHREEPNSRCAIEVSSKKIVMFGEEYAAQTLSGVYAILDVNGLMLKEKDHRLRPGLVTTGRGVMDGVAKSLETTTKMQKYMRGRNGQRGASIVFQNICGTARFDNGRIIDRYPFIDSAKLTLSKPLLDFLSNVNNLRRIVEWGDRVIVLQPLITERSSGGIDFTQIPAAIEQIFAVMGIRGLWTSWETQDGVKMLADQNGCPTEMIGSMNGVLRGVTDRNADRVAAIC
jgi:hypothetical protein